jgi:hypothetical protein
MMGAKGKIMRKIAIRSLLLSAFLLAMSGASFAQIGFSITIAPPVLPVYEQPICPGDGYIWTPGYWAWDPDAGDYYWVPGTWVVAPEVGFLWTPPWWGWSGGFYVFHAGYWGPHVGFYGGINYGFGYFGHGFEGGRWEGGHFFYNRAVANINVNVIHNVYENRVDVREVNHVSYNGGRGGIEARPTREEETAEHERHINPVADQTRHEQTARSNPQFRAKSNGGRPPVTATARPGEFGGREAGGGAARPTHVRELPPVEHVAPPKTGNAKQDQRYQKQANDLAAKHEKERQNLQQKQEQEHQQMDRQHATDERRQQVEQKHQQQTQQLQQRHEQERQQLQSRQQASAGRKK